MQKIASPNELQAELRSIMAFIHASEKPDRQVIASKLNELADRLAAAGPTFKVRDVGGGDAKGTGEHIEMDIGGKVKGVEVKGVVRRVWLSNQDITPRLMTQVITVNLAEGGHVPPGVKKKVEQATLKKLQELQRAWEKKNGR